MPEQVRLKKITYIHVIQSGGILPYCSILEGRHKGRLTVPMGVGTIVVCGLVMVGVWPK